MIIFVLRCIYLMMPAYFANMAPVMIKNLHILNSPVDFNIQFRGKRLFGKNKTFRGLFFGVLFSILVAYLQYRLGALTFFKSLEFLDYGNWIIIGLLLGSGAVFGDLIESFFKRQLGLKPGKPLVPFDQLDFVIGALVLLYFIYVPSWQILVTVIAVSPVLHIVINHLAYFIRVRNERW